MAWSIKDALAGKLGEGPKVPVLEDRASRGSGSIEPVAPEGLSAGSKELFNRGAKSAGILGVGLFSYYVWPALIEELVSPLEDKKQERSFTNKWAHALVRTGLSSFIGIRDMANGVLEGRDPSAGLLSTMFKTLADPVKDLLRKNVGMDRARRAKTLRHSITALGGLTGLTNAQEGKVAQFITEYSLGKEHPKGPWQWATGLRYGETKGHSRTMQEYTQSLGGKRR